MRRFETELLKFVENSRPGLLADIAEKKALTDDIKAGLKQVLEDVKDTWQKQTAPPVGFTPVRPPAAPAQPATTAAAQPVA